MSRKGSIVQTTWRFNDLSTVPFDHVFHFFNRISFLHPVLDFEFKAVANIVNWFDLKFTESGTFVSYFT